MAKFKNLVSEVNKLRDEAKERGIPLKKRYPYSFHPVITGIVLIVVYTIGLWLLIAIGPRMGYNWASVNLFISYLLLLTAICFVIFSIYTRCSKHSLLFYSRRNVRKLEREIVEYKNLIAEDELTVLAQQPITEKVSKLSKLVAELGGEMQFCIQQKKNPRKRHYIKLKIPEVRRSMIFQDTIWYMEPNSYTELVLFLDKALQEREKAQQQARDIADKYGLPRP